MKSGQRFLFLVLAAMGLAGCGDDAPVGVCYFNTPGACFQLDGDADAARAGCTERNGRFQAGLVCPADDRLGGCRHEYTSDEGSWSETVWFYPHEDQVRQSEAEVRESCDTWGGEFLPGS